MTSEHHEFESAVTADSAKFTADSLPGESAVNATRNGLRVSDPQSISTRNDNESFTADSKFIPFSLLTSIPGLGARHLRRLAARRMIHTRIVGHNRGQPIREAEIDSLPKHFHAAARRLRRRQGVAGSVRPPRAEASSCRLAVPAEPGHMIRTNVRHELPAEIGNVTFDGRGIPIDPNGHVLTEMLRSMGREKAADIFEKKFLTLRALKAAKEAAVHGQKLVAGAAIAKEIGVPFRSVAGWEQKLIKEGEAALVPKESAFKGKTKKVPREIQRVLLLQRNSQTQASYAQCWHLADSLCRARGIPSPNYWDVQRFIKANAKAPATETAHRKGKKAHADRWRVRASRDPEQLRPGEIWCGDHRLADVMVRLTADLRSRVFRPMLTLFIDIASADPIGWAIREQPSSEGVAAAFRRACLGFTEAAQAGQETAWPARGLPDCVIIDNGREFWGGAMAAACDWESSESDFLPDKRHRTVLTQLGVKLIQCIAFNPQSKPIEAWFTALANAENLLPGYCGRDCKEKPEALRRQVERGALLTLAQFRAWFADWAWNRRLARPVGHKRLRPPAAYWEGAPIRVVDAAQLDALLVRDGFITLSNSLIEIRGMGRYAPIEQHRAAFLDARGRRCKRLFARDDPRFVILYAGANRIVLRRLPDEDDWWGAHGGPPSDQFREVQALNSLDRARTRESGHGLSIGVDPMELAESASWSQAAHNASADTHRLRLPAPDPSSPPNPEPPPPNPSAIWLARAERRARLIEETCDGPHAQP